MKENEKREDGENWPVQYPHMERSAVFFSGPLNWPGDQVISYFPSLSVIDSPSSSSERISRSNCTMRIKD